ncbi:MAG: hypothetical protein AAF264_14160 [Pseudomonadota bacterium]
MTRSIRPLCLLAILALAACNTDSPLVFGASTDVSPVGPEVVLVGTTESDDYDR